MTGIKFCTVTFTLPCQKAFQHVASPQNGALTSPIFKSRMLKSCWKNHLHMCPETITDVDGSQSVLPMNWYKDDTKGTKKTHLPEHLTLFICSWSRQAGQVEGGGTGPLHQRRGDWFWHWPDWGKGKAKRHLRVYESVLSLPTAFLAQQAVCKLIGTEKIWSLLWAMAPCMREKQRDQERNIAALSERKERERLRKAMSTLLCIF